MSDYNEVKEKMEARAADMTPERMLEVAKHYMKSGGMTFPDDVTVAEAVAMVEYFDVGVHRVEKMGADENEIESSIQTTLTGMLINLKDVDTYHALTLVERLSVHPRILAVTFETSPLNALLASLETVLSDDVYDIPKEDIALTKRHLEETTEQLDGRDISKIVEEIKRKLSE